MMDDLQFEQVETRLRETAAGFNYPPLPDISSRVLPRLNQLRNQDLSEAKVDLGAGHDTRRSSGTAGSSPGARSVPGVFAGGGSSN
jgi:hypothetical protein